MYAEAALLTLRLALEGVFLSLVLGLLCSMVQYFKIPVLRKSYLFT